MRQQFDLPTNCYEARTFLADCYNHNLSAMRSQRIQENFDKGKVNIAHAEAESIILGAYHELVGECLTRANWRKEDENTRQSTD